MERKLRKRLYTVSIAALMLCMVASIGLAQTPIDASAAPASQQFDLVTDGAGFCWLPKPVQPGDRVQCNILYRGVGDEGIPTAWMPAYPLDVMYNVAGVSTERMRRKIFDYDKSSIVVKDGLIKLDFVVPKGVVVLELKFAVRMSGGSLYGETADRDWAFLYDKLDDKTQTIQIKMLVRTGETKL